MISYSELLRFALPEVILTATMLVVLALGLAKSRVSGFCSGITAAGLFFAMADVLSLPPHANLFDGMLVISPLVSLFQIICLGLSFFTLLLPGNERSLGNHGEYLALLLLATIGLLLLISSEELLMIFIGLELTGLSLYLLTAFAKTSSAAAEAGLKYFLFGSVASAITLFGISLIYGITKANSLTSIGLTIAAGPVQPLLVVGVLMTLIAFAFKIAAAPFHFWVADTYEAAPIPSAAFIASGSKVASFVVLGKILFLGFAPLAGNAAWHNVIAGWRPILAVLAALSILLGNLLALVQKNVRRLLGYSAVAHGGYTLLGLIAGPEGFPATLFYTTIYALTLVGAFGVVGLVRQETGGDELSNFAGLRARAPWLATCMTVFLLSLGGLPPLAGFFGKFYLFAQAMRVAPTQGLTWLVALALGGSLISLYYYLIVAKVMLVDAPEEKPAPLPSAKQGVALPFFSLTSITLCALAFVTLVLGIYPDAFVRPIVEALR